MNAYVQLTSAARNFTSVSGGNSGGTAGNFVAQTFTDADATAGTVRYNFIVQGGTGGYATQRTYTSLITSTDIVNGDSFTLTLGRTTDVAAATFVLYDNVSIDVTVIPEPSTYGLMGAGALAAVSCIRRRRAAKVA